MGVREESWGGREWERKGVRKEQGEDERVAMRPGWNADMETLGWYRGWVNQCWLEAADPGKKSVARLFFLSHLFYLELHIFFSQISSFV